MFDRNCRRAYAYAFRNARHLLCEGLFIVGMKSYGRAPTFLLLTGYEQVRSVAAALAGDWESAREVRLVLPETGVCGLPPRQPALGTVVATAGCGKASEVAAV